jgi:hypothetical protein
MNPNLVSIYPLRTFQPSGSKGTSGWNARDLARAPPRPLGQRRGGSGSMESTGLQGRSDLLWTATAMNVLLEAWQRVSEVVGPGEKAGSSQGNHPALQRNMGAGQ